MDGRRWRRVDALFHEALERPAEGRRAFLAERAGGDDELVAIVERMLRADARRDALLDGGLESAADRLLDDTGAVAGRVVGRYRLLEPLGEGGMGVVHLAERTDLGGRVAVKILRDAALSPARRARFEAERRLLARLNHPNIAALHDADTLEDGTPWFAMEYVDGVPLTVYCRRHGTSISGRMQLVRAVCEAVAYAHRHAVIHRDLKPSNILVRQDGAIRLLDFGIAKQLDVLDDADDTGDATKTSLRMLTPAYAAPEQLRGDPPGIQADVYSLGVILYELLTGDRPFDVEARSPGEALEAIEREPPDPPSRRARRLAASLPGARRRVRSWGELDVLCLTALHRDPDRRYGSAEALMRDIDRFLAGEPLEAHRDTVGYRMRKFASRNARALSLAATLLLAGVALTAFYGVRLAHARDRAVAEAARTARIQAFLSDLFAGGDLEAGPADDLRVVTLVDRGAQEAAAFEGEPALQAELHQTLGTIYTHLGKFGRADRQLTAALELRRAQPSGNDDVVAESLLSLAELRLAEARLDEAEPLIDEALGLVGSRASLRRSQAYSARGRLLEERGDYAGAIAAHREAVDLLERIDAPESERSRALGALANSHYYAGELDASHELNERVLEIDRRLLGDVHPNVADDLINLGAIEFARGHYAESEAMNRRAYGILRDWYGPDHPQTASAQTILARSLVYLERRDEAEPLLREALAVQERVYGDHPRVASALNDLSNVLMFSGRFDEAEGLCRRQIAIYERSYGERHPFVAIALSNVANIALLRERYAEAERILRDVVARFAEAYAPDHRDTAIARIKLGRAIVRQERWADAERELRAGHDALSAVADASVSWLRSAREDLALAYERLGRPEEAAAFRR